MSVEQPDFLKFFAYRLAYTRGLVDLMQMQESAIQDNDISKLMEILSHKQSILNEIELQQQEFPQWQNSWEEQRAFISIQTRTQCERLFHEIQKLLGELLIQEQSNIEQLAVQRDDVLGQLDALSSSLKQQGAYQQKEELMVSLLDFSQ